MNTSLDATLAWLTRNKVKLIFTVLFVIVVTILLNFSILVVELDGSANGAQVTLRQNAERNSGGKTIRAGVNIVRRGHLYVEAKKDDQMTSGYIQTGFFRVSRVTLSLTTQNKLQKITENGTTTDCLFGDLSNTYYICNKSRLWKKQLGSLKAGTPFLENVTIIGTPKSYQAGILALAATTDTTKEEGGSQLLYITPSGAQVIDSGARKYIDAQGGAITTDSSSKQFVVNNVSAKTLFIFNGQNSKPISYSYSKDLPETVNTKTIRANFSGGEVILSYSFGEKDHDDQEHSEDIGQTRLTTYQLGEKSVTKTSDSELPKEAQNTTDIQTIDGYVFAHNTVTGDLWIFKNQQADLELYAKIPNTDYVTTDGGKLFFSKGSSVYWFNTETNTAHLARKSRTAITTLTPAGNNFIVSGPVQNSTAVASFVLLTNSKKTGTTEPADILPYKIDELPVMNSDFSGNTLSFTLRLNSTRYVRDAGTSSYDQREYDLKKAMVLRRLRHDGLSPAKYRVEFKATP